MPIWLKLILDWWLAVIWASCMWAAMRLWFSQPTKTPADLIADDSAVSSFLVEVGDAVMTREEVDALWQVRERWSNTPVEAH